MVVNMIVCDFYNRGRKDAPALGTRQRPGQRLGGAPVAADRKPGFLAQDAFDGGHLIGGQDAPADVDPSHVPLE